MEGEGGGGSLQFSPPVVFLSLTRVWLTGCPLTLGADIACKVATTFSTEATVSKAHEDTWTVIM